MKGFSFSTNNRFLGWTLLIILAFIWGSSFILIKKGLLAFSPGEVGALRILFASVALTPLALVNLKKVRKHQWKLLLSVGFVGSFMPAFLFAIAQTHIDSAIAGVLNALTPLFVLIIGAVIYHQIIYRHMTTGLVIGFLGTALLIFSGTGGQFKNLNFYALLVVLATICYGINVNLIKYKIESLNAKTITSISIVMVGPIAAIYLFTGTDFISHLDHEMAVFSLLALVLLGVLGTAIALILFNKMIKITTPIFSSSVTYLIPIVALIWGLADGETLLWPQLAGMIFILSGVFIANKK